MSSPFLRDYSTEIPETWYLARTPCVVVHIIRKFWSYDFYTPVWDWTFYGIPLTVRLSSTLGTITLKLFHQLLWNFSELFISIEVSSFLIFINVKFYISVLWIFFTLLKKAETAKEIYLLKIVENKPFVMTHDYLNFIEAIVLIVQIFLSIFYFLLFWGRVGIWQGSHKIVNFWGYLVILYHDNLIYEAYNLAFIGQMWNLRLHCGYWYLEYFQSLSYIEQSFMYWIIGNSLLIEPMK